MYADNYYGYLEELVHTVPGLEFLVEPYGTGKKNFDETAIRGIGDMVMCEFWTSPARWGWETLLPVASNAHINGQKVVAAEAFTGQPQYGWQNRFSRPEKRWRQSLLSRRKPVYAGMQVHISPGQT